MLEQTDRIESFFIKYSPPNICSLELEMYKHDEEGLSVHVSEEVGDLIDNKVVLSAFPQN